MNSFNCNKLNNTNKTYLLVSVVNSLHAQDSESSNYTPIFPGFVYEKIYIYIYRVANNSYYK